MTSPSGQCTDIDPGSGMDVEERVWKFLDEIPGKVRADYVGGDGHVTVYNQPSVLQLYLDSEWPDWRLGGRRDGGQESATNTAHTAKANTVVEEVIQGGSQGPRAHATHNPSKSPHTAPQEQERTQQSHQDPWPSTSDGCADCSTKPTRHVTEAEVESDDEVVEAAFQLMRRRKWPPRRVLEAIDVLRAQQPVTVDDGIETVHRQPSARRDSPGKNFQHAMTAHPEQAAACEGSIPDNSIQSFGTDDDVEKVLQQSAMDYHEQRGLQPRNDDDRADVAETNQVRRPALQEAPHGRLPSPKGQLNGPPPPRKPGRAHPQSNQRDESRAPDTAVTSSGATDPIELEILDEVRIKREDVIANDIIEEQAALLRRRQREMRERLGDLGADADKAAGSRRQLSAAANQQAGDRTSRAAQAVLLVSRSDSDGHESLQAAEEGRRSTHQSSSGSKRSTATVQAAEKQIAHFGDAVFDKETAGTELDIAQGGSRKKKKRRVGEEGVDTEAIDQVGRESGGPRKRARQVPGQLGCFSDVTAKPWPG